LGISLGWAALSASAAAVRPFAKQQLTPYFWSEGTAIGDLNRDGKADIVSGPFWYQGPEFKVQHPYRCATNTARIKKPDGTEQLVPGFKGALGTENDYSDAFITFVYDFNADQWPDIFVIGMPGEAIFWFENPGKAPPLGTDRFWVKHHVFDTLGNESPMFADLTGDGRPEVLGNAGGAFGYLAADWRAPAKPWTFHPISPKGNWGKYTHGVGCGDINGDGRADLIEQGGWWEQPPSLAGDPVWTVHPVALTPPAPDGGAAQMHAYDVNGDGLNDVITCLHPHHYGLVWHEQYRETGAIRFRRHLIMGTDTKDNPSGVRFSQPHAIELADINGDGLQDIITGKRFWAHGPDKDSEPNAPAVLYWFELARKSGGAVEFIPHLLDNDSGVGTQLAVRDTNGDGRPDIVTANKKGTHVFTQSSNGEKTPAK